MPNASGPTCSVVIPVYYNEGSIRDIYSQIQAQIATYDRQMSFEVVFIDDGSGDRSYAELKELQKEFPDHVRLIKLTRNFGQPAARLAGLRAARGDCIVSMSADGQDPPQLLPQMLKAHFEEGFLVVIGERSGRDEGWFRSATSSVFFRVMRWLSFDQMPTGGFSYVLLGRKPLDVILRNQDSNPFFQGQVLWTGFAFKSISFHRPARTVGRSRWTIGKKLTLLLDGVLNYSYFPIRAISLAGTAVCVVGLVAALAIIVRWAVYGTEVQGWPTLMVLGLLMGGGQLLMQGVIGEYLWRTLAQTRNRDLYVVEDEIDHTKRDGELRS